VEASRARRARLATAFTHPGVADAYQHRPPYPAEVFEILVQLITDEPRRVLDLGTGEGAIARPLAGRVEHVDALDISAAMIEAGRCRPGGRQHNLRWIAGAAETAALGGPYALVTAGASLHWMSWEPTLARLAPAMTGRAFLAIVDQDHRQLPWSSALNQVIARHSRSASYDPRFRLADELSARGLLEIAGRRSTAPVPFRQPVEDYIEHFHSTSSLAREWMTVQESAAFDRDVAEVVRSRTADGVVELDVTAHLVWGRITAGP
jgi:SAM-dependent methyltransferase